MSMIRADGVLGILVLLGAGLALAESPAERRKTLETAVPEGIRLLEAKEYATFLKNYVEPEHFKKLTQSIPLEKFARNFGEGKAEVLLRVLKAIEKEKPTLDDNGTKATYTLKEPVNGKSTIVWVKVEDLWYIRN